MIYFNILNHTLNKSFIFIQIIQIIIQIIHPMSC